MGNKVIEALEKWGAELITGDDHTKDMYIIDMLHGHQGIYYVLFPHIFTIRKSIDIGTYSTDIDAEFKINTVKDLDTIMRSFMHFDTGAIVVGM